MSKCFQLLVAAIAASLCSESGAAEFRPISIVCVETEDTVGADDVYLTAGGRTIWGPKQMNDGDSLRISLSRKCTFEDEVVIELYDEDSPDADDLLGNHTVYADGSASRDLTVTFRNDGAHYVLTYRVLP